MVPWPVRVAAEWAWRLVLFGIVLYFAFQALAAVALVALALFAAVVLAALLHPAVDALTRLHAPRLLATLVVFVGGLGLLALAAWFVTQRFTNRLSEIGAGIEGGIARLRTWMRNGPLDLTAAQVEQAVGEITARVRTGALGESAFSTAMTAAEIVGGMVLALFLLFFFLYDGQRITTWALRLFPRSIEDDVREAGRRAWAALGAYMRATILVAFIDGFFIGLTLVLLGVPLAVPLAVLTFLGAFVPLIGATVTGAVAVLVALVSNGVTTALLVLAAVLAVQQLEGNVLAPLILGRALSLHPVAIALVVAVGALLAGIAGAVVAVPLTAVTHAVVSYFRTGPGRSPAGPPGQGRAACECVTDLELHRGGEGHREDTGHTSFSGAARAPRSCLARPDAFGCRFGP